MSTEPQLVNGEDAPSSTGTSRSLLEAARVRTPGSWDRLVALYAPLVLHWCRQWGVREQDTADVFQDVFQSVALHLSGFHRGPAGGTFRGWLRTITRNKVTDTFRRLQKEPPGVGGSEAQSRLAQLAEVAPAYDDSADAAVSALLRRGLELIRCEFEAHTWQAFWLTAVEGRAPKDVADELGMTGGAVRVAKSRVLHRLRAELGDYTV
ncbi:sigma-70 family RNA polymerase sigma factor [Gemmata sp. G18]|uniref:Sigma-70 family RNA polymerase sigma factor n=1 Tax=Gemmata palustris TaxID=2822762 RepID=A0ABS5BK76_9BACT|nr:sigma-70 family RNA polymerase sigma factor [Gemmata palustris]MBP3954098.1 sigma-70 family RNA polymerase sigma factor [Gemmata palustris]